MKSSPGWYQRWNIALSTHWGCRGLSLGRFVEDSVSASHQEHISALCHPHSLAVTHGPSISLVRGAQRWPQMLFRTSLERHNPWGCSEPRFLGEASQVKSPWHQATELPGQGKGPSWKKWSLFPLVEQLGDQSSAWQDIGALVCSAVFAREYLPRCVWVTVKQSEVRAPQHLPSPAAMLWFSAAAWQAPGTLSCTGKVETLGSSIWERS